MGPARGALGATGTPLFPVLAAAEGERGRGSAVSRAAGGGSVRLSRGASGRVRRGSEPRGGGGGGGSSRGRTRLTSANAVTCGPRPLRCAGVRGRRVAPGTLRCTTWSGPRKSSLRACPARGPAGRSRSPVPPAVSAGLGLATGAKSGRHLPSREAGRRVAPSQLALRPGGRIFSPQGLLRAPGWSRDDAGPEALLLLFACGPAQLLVPPRFRSLHVGSRPLGDCGGCGRPCRR